MLVRENDEDDSNEGGGGGGGSGNDIANVNISMNDEQCIGQDIA